MWNLINEEILPDSLKYYVMFFVGDPMKMDMITKTLEPIPLCDRLFQSEYESVVKKVRELMINKCMLFASIIYWLSLFYRNRIKKIIGQVLYHKGNKISSVYARLVLTMRLHSSFWEQSQ